MSRRSRRARARGVRRPCARYFAVRVDGAVASRSNPAAFYFVTRRSRGSSQGIHGAAADPSLAADVATCDYGWHEATQPEIAETLPSDTALNFAALPHPHDCDPASGSNNLKSVRCRLEKLTPSQ